MGVSSTNTGAPSMTLHAPPGHIGATAMAPGVGVVVGSLGATGAVLSTPTFPASVPTTPCVHQASVKLAGSAERRRDVPGLHTHQRKLRAQLHAAVRQVRARARGDGPCVQNARAEAPAAAGERDDRFGGGTPKYGGLEAEPPGQKEHSTAQTRQRTCFTRNRAARYDAAARPPAELRSRLGPQAACSGRRWLEAERRSSSSSSRRAKKARNNKASDEEQQGGRVNSEATSARRRGKKKIKRKPEKGGRQ